MSVSKPSQKYLFRHTFLTVSQLIAGFSGFMQV